MTTKDSTSGIIVSITGPSLSTGFLSFGCVATPAAMFSGRSSETKNPVARSASRVVSVALLSALSVTGLSSNSKLLRFYGLLNRSFGTSSEFLCSSLQIARPFNMCPK